MAAILKRLKELGHTRAYLVTQTVRLPAISLYLGLGFKPLVKTEEEKAHWKGVHTGPLK
jgi:hypothetical protein